VKPRYSVEYLPAAERDLLDIVDYIARDNPPAARKFVERVDHAVGRLRGLSSIGT
jgi:plasmid stabilization system protein ParE